MRDRQAAGEPIGNGLVALGPSNPTSLRRMANYCGALVKSGEPIPPSPFIAWAADRLTGSDRQDLVLIIQGRRGSGKSYSALYIGKRLAEAIAERKRGTKWQDFFGLDSCATLEDSEKVLQLLNDSGKHKVVLIDDASLAVSNRSWNSPQNRNFNALLSVCRTNRWCLILTAPLKKHLDNQIREMSDLSCTVYKSFHTAGFNILKINSSDIGGSGKEYLHRMSFDKKKIDFWATFKPDAELTKEYDRQRDESARTLNKRIVETGSFKKLSKQLEPKISTAERNDLVFIEEQGKNLKKFLQDNPGASINKISARFGLTGPRMQRIVNRVTEEPT